MTEQILPNSHHYSHSTRIRPGSQRSCKGLPRKYAPAPMPAEPPCRPRSRYRTVIWDRDHWRCRFYHQNVPHCVPGTFDSEHDAARAYNAYIREHGLDQGRYGRKALRVSEP